ncbi:peroxide stress protein YaaA [Weissella sagaensis]|jgi:cytoplasmic iron level regulating protein YaaA (DUF328/UPF0246 family)|uniref:peroxide stress protein YaaA n=1 Tax=Weissella sagaensis TaxID=2559928 RepID=UPI00114F7A8D|nr:peroxide stress protein YaaA [Weissella sagaensis]QDJ58780.1 peroxide stress protein YaaA [Weissella hellenica]
MQIIISPAKKMTIDQDNFTPINTPCYLEQSLIIQQKLLSLSYDELKKLWQTSDKLTTENYNQLHHTNSNTALTPAIFSYTGIQYQYMAPNVLSEQALSYLQNHLWILSAFYGVLRPFDGIVPYRLEMKSRLKINDSRNLYEFWGDTLYQMIHNHEPIINLASKEYAQSIRPFLQPEDEFIDIIFAHIVAGKLKVKATDAKMARGEMVRFIVENQLTTIDKLKQFKTAVYSFDASQSTDHKLVFIYH